MKEYIVTASEEGMMLHKYLLRVLPNAGGSFLYKMLRKKNILLNGNKAAGNEKLLTGDVVRVYFSDETILKFEGTAQITDSPLQSLPDHLAIPFEVLFENEDILAVNKPAGMLTQKASQKDVSLNELLISYLIKQGSITPDSMKTVRPSVCNRLDRNTSGIVLCGKTMKGLQLLSKALKERSAHKYYKAWVLGNVTGDFRVEGFLDKDNKNNKVKITAEKNNDDQQYICTEYHDVEHASVLGRDVTLLEILLVTGRSHQIRAHLSSLGHPLLGDPKYGDLKLNRQLSQNCNIRRQLLHSYKTVLQGFPEIHCPLPGDMLPGHWKKG